MFTTLLESRAARTRRTGGTTLSFVVHGALIAAGVTFTAQTKTPERKPPETIPVKFMPLVHEPPPQTHQPAPQQSAPTTPMPRVDLVIAPPTITPNTLPPITPGREISTDIIQIGGRLPPAGVIGAPINTSEVMEAENVERAPSVLGKPRPPHYPSVLRETGTTGRVVLRFVTLGRAEFIDITVVESSHMLFTEAVKSVLPDYRFTPGEVGGRKVRTMVQMPFVFSLDRR
jgi:protein TonB